MTNKYQAKKTIYNGNRYDSVKEASYAQQLDVLKNAKMKQERVIDVDRQVRLPIKIDNVLICTYICDFRVTYQDGRIEHIDVKGYRGGSAYAMFRLKKKLVKACYQIDVIEV